MIDFVNGMFCVTVFYQGKKFCETFDKLYEAVALVEQFILLENEGIDIAL